MEPRSVQQAPAHDREAADVETSSEGYARRFAGPVGAWFLETQGRSTLALMGGLPHGAKLLDVGGGHAQLTPWLVQAGYRVVVLGSAPACADRLTRWLADDRCRFDVGDPVDLPYPDRSFDAALCFRLLPHVGDWKRLISEVCRVSGIAVVLDYPSIRSVNLLSERLFGLKKRIEGDTRPFTLFAPGEVGKALGTCRFRVVGSAPQFLLPMVLHRSLGSAVLARALEAPGRLLGLTRWLGSPIIVRADRCSERP